MALADKETLEKFYKEILDNSILRHEFISFEFIFDMDKKIDGIRDIRLKDIFTPLYKSLLNEYKLQSEELRISNNLEF